MAGTLPAQEYSFRTFGNAEGLANLAVRQIYQDRGGFLWVSTENGIFRYDGDRFESFGPAQGIPATSARVRTSTATFRPPRRKPTRRAEPSRWREVMHALFCEIGVGSAAKLSQAASESRCRVSP